MEALEGESIPGESIASKGIAGKGIAGKVVAGKGVAGKGFVGIGNVREGIWTLVIEVIQTPTGKGTTQEQLAKDLEAFVGVGEGKATEWSLEWTLFKFADRMRLLASLATGQKDRSTFS